MLYLAQMLLPYCAVGNVIAATATTSFVALRPCSMSMHTSAPLPSACWCPSSHSARTSEILGSNPAPIHDLTKFACRKFVDDCPKEYIFSLNLASQHRIHSEILLNISENEQWITLHTALVGDVFETLKETGISVVSPLWRIVYWHRQPSTICEESPKLDFSVCKKLHSNGTTLM